MFDAQIALPTGTTFSIVQERLADFAHEAGPKIDSQAAKRDTETERRNPNKSTETEASLTDEHPEGTDHSVNPLGACHPLRTPLPGPAINYSRPIRSVTEPLSTSHLAGGDSTSPPDMAAEMPPVVLENSGLPQQPIRRKETGGLMMAFWPGKSLANKRSSAKLATKAHGARSVSFGGHMTPSATNTTASSLPTRSNTYPSPTASREKLKTHSSNQNAPCLKASGAKGSSKDRTVPGNQSAENVRLKLAPKPLRPPWTYEDSPPHGSSLRKDQSRIPSATSVPHVTAKTNVNTEHPSIRAPSKPRDISYETKRSASQKSNSLPSLKGVRTPSVSRLPRLITTPATASSTSSGSSPRSPGSYGGSKLPLPRRSFNSSSIGTSNRLAALREKRLASLEERRESSVYYSAEEDVTDEEEEMF